MIRLALVAALALVAPAHAQNGPDNEDARYSFHRAGDSYLRLDGRTGQVSVCENKPTGWLCRAVPDERSALESEIARLQHDNVALKRELLAHDLTLPGGAKAPGPQAKEQGLQLPSDAEIDQVMTVMEKVWRRMVEMIVSAQRDMLRKP